MRVAKFGATPEGSGAAADPVAVADNLDADTAGDEASPVSSRSRGRRQSLKRQCSSAHSSQSTNRMSSRRSDMTSRIG